MRLCCFPRAKSPKSGNPLLLQPARQRLGDFGIDLPRHFRHYRPTLSCSHEIPHRPRFGLTALYIRGTGFIGDKMKFTMTQRKAALLVFVSTHGSWLVEEGRVRSSEKRTRMSKQFSLNLIRVPSPESVRQGPQTELTHSSFGFDRVIRNPFDQFLKICRGQIAANTFQPLPYFVLKPQPLIHHLNHKKLS